MATEDQAQQTSNYLLEKFKFGELNPVGSSTTRTMVDLNTADATMDTVRFATRTFFKHNALKGTGPYKGIVLRIDDAGTAGVPGQVSRQGSGFSNYTSILGDGAGLVQTAGTLSKIRVRIPEIHAALPIPKSLPVLTQESPDHRIIDMYPQFVAETTSVLIPAQAGDLVWVDFGNRKTLEDPIYIAPVENGVAVYNSQSPPGAYDAFNRAPPSKIPGGGTTVDSMFKKFANGSVWIRRPLAGGRFETLRTDL